MGIYMRARVWTFLHARARLCTAYLCVEVYRCMFVVVCVSVCARM